MKQKKNLKKYSSFTLVEMLITMAVMTLIFLAMGNVITNMIRASNTVSSRMIVRQEGEYISEVFRKYIRNSATDGVKLFRRSGEITFVDYEPTAISDTVTPVNFGSSDKATEIHFRPSGEETTKVVCIGFFKDGDGRGYILRSVNDFSGDWNLYNPSDCFPSAPQSDQTFRKNFAFLNSDLLIVDNLEIESTQTSANIYYGFDIDMRPVWGLGGASNYRDVEDTPIYRKSFVVQTRQIFYW